MNKKIIWITTIIIILIITGVYSVLNQQKSSSLQTITNPITISGEISCLPKTGQGAQTKECAMGLKGIGIDRRYYGLKNLFKLDPEYKFSVGGLRV